MSLRDNQAREGKERYCSRCGEVLEPDEKSWCKLCRNENSKRDYRENRERRLEGAKEYRMNHSDEIKENYKSKTERRYLYSEQNVDDRSIYTGTTNDMYRRTREHTKGESHLGLKPEKWVELGLKSVRYIDITDFIEDDEGCVGVVSAERSYLERLYILANDNEEMLNDDLPNPILSVERMEQLEYDFENCLKDSYEEMEIVEVVGKDGEIGFNWKDWSF